MTLKAGFLLVLSLIFSPSIHADLNPISTGLTSSSNPSIYGQPIILTAYTMKLAGYIPLSGRVTFYDGTSLLGIVSAADIFTTLSATLPPGKHALKAYYSGDSRYAPSLSNTLSQTVNSRPGNGLSTPVNYSAGAAPSSVASADFNADGKTDLVVSNYVANTVSVFLGKGDGTFQPAVNYPTGNGPYGVSVGDFNGDGNPDLAVANRAANTVGILLGNGDGTFRTPVNYPVGAPSNIAVGDFNRDGVADLAVTNQRDNKIGILLGNGDGTFQSAVNCPNVGFTYQLDTSSLSPGIHAIFVGALNTNPTQNPGFAFIQITVPTRPVQ